MGPKMNSVHVQKSEKHARKSKYIHCRKQLVHLYR